jgi:peptide chain release factor subunit 1
MQSYSKNFEEENFIEMFKLKKTIEYLDTKKGHGTSLITITIGANDQIVHMRKKLVEEEGKAKQIKTRVTRQNAIDALVSAGEKLKLYTRTPKNGLIIFCGVTDTEEKIKHCF